MSWLRSSAPKPNTRYSFTVNFEARPELEALAHYLWSLSPAPTSRNHAIIQLLQAGFQAHLMRDAADGHPQSPVSAPRPPSATPPVAPSLAVSQAERPTPRPVAGSDAEAPDLSPAASRFLTQFDD